MSKAPPKRPHQAGHMVSVTKTAEKKRKSADRNSLDLKNQIAQRIREARQEGLVGVPEAMSQMEPLSGQSTLSCDVPPLALSHPSSSFSSASSSSSPAQPMHHIISISTADTNRFAVQALQAKEKTLLEALFATWVRRHDFNSRSCAFATRVGGAECKGDTLATVYCNGCEAFLCQSCDQREHAFIRLSHLWYQQRGRGEQPVIISGSLVFTAQCGCAEVKQPNWFRNVVVVYLTHRKEAVIWYHKECSTPFAAQILSVHLFPGSLDPTVVFHESFLNLALLLLAKAAMPRVRMVKVFNHLHAQICTKVDGSPFPSLEKPFLFALRVGLSFDRQKDTLSGLCPSLPSHPTCLACFYLDPVGTDPHADTGKVVMIDGICKLANQKRESKEKYYPHKDKLFIPQVLTDEFESQLGDLKEGANNGCSQHTAAEKAQSTRKGQTYESTATFTSSCRHHVPLKFLSMKFGERYAYPILLLLVLSVYINKWSYDICCLLLPGILKVISNRVRWIAAYATARGPDVLLDLVQRIVEYRESCGLGQRSVSSNTSTSSSADLVQAELTAIKDKPAGVGLLHILAHRWACQVLYSLKRLVGFGLTDGEEIERLHALLAPFATMYRSMRLEAAQEFMSEVVRLLADDLNLRLSKTLLKKRSVAVSRCIHASLSLDNILKAGSRTVTRETIEAWIREEEDKARDSLSERGRRGAFPAVEKSAQFRYIDHLRAYWNELSTHGQNHSKVRRLETKLKDLETQLNVASRWTADSSVFIETQTRLFTQRRDESKQKLWDAVCVRVSLIVRQKSHSSSHKQNMYIERAIKRETKKLQLQYAVYVECESAVTSEDNTIIERRSPLEVVQKTDSEFWSGYTSSSNHKLIIQLYTEILRTKEEVTILQAECNRHVLNLQYLLTCVSGAIQKSEALISGGGESKHDLRYLHGSVCLLRKHQLRLASQLDQATKTLTFFRLHSRWTQQSSPLTSGLAEVVADPSWRWADEIPFSVESDSDSETDDQ